MSWNHNLVLNMNYNPEYATWIKTFSKKWIVHKKVIGKISLYTDLQELEILDSQ